MSPSTRPAMIWSRMFFWVHWSEQKLQVLASSRRDTRKSSNVSPSCWTRLRKLRRSTDSLICPCTYRSMAAMISVVFCSCSVVRPRLTTIVTVSREKQSVRAWTYLAFDWPSSPDRLKYASHCAFHALKSVPRSTFRSSLGRSPCRKTYGMVGSVAVHSAM